MEKADAIKEAYEKRKKAHEAKFIDEVEFLVSDIESVSNRLRDLKVQLAELEYKEPEKIGRII